MKKIVFTTLFIFSIVLNLAVAATIGWHYWGAAQAKDDAESKEPHSFKGDLKSVHKLWPKQTRREMMELKRKVREKRAEVLDILAANQGRPEAAENAVNELIAVTAQMERKAVAGISAVMTSLPEDQRQGFVAFLKKRQLLRHKLKMGRWRGGSRGSCGPGSEGPNVPPKPATMETSPDGEESSRDSSPASVKH